MEMEDYKAKYMKAANRKSYTITFRHPMVKDEGKNYGIKVHRGLGTTDETIAIELTAEMNTLLGDDSWWNKQKRMEAYQRFNEKIVDAFYDPMNRSERCNDTYLEKILLPGKKEGYKATGFVGMSGAGKTSAIRHACGTAKDRFPTTSSGRTTTCNMEIIMAESPVYEAVVTFIPRGRLEMLVQESIEEAVKYLVKEGISDINKMKTMEKLLEHENLTTRLNYILGDYSLRPEDEEDELDYIMDDEDEDESFIPDNLNELIERLDKYFAELVIIAKQYEGKTLELEDGNIELTSDNNILELRDEIVDDVQERFSLLENGEKLNPKGKWFEAWYYQSEDREGFLQVIKKFSSNAKSEWGNLLTPIVESMRIKGPFKPTFCSTVPKLVLYDGEGLGHKMTISSVPLSTMDMMDRWDNIILVDNAAAPIMDTTRILLKTIIDSGYAGKLMLAFTHFDDMEGDNMRRSKDKVRHVRAAISSYLTEISKKDPHALLETDKNNILSSCYFFSKLDKESLTDFSQDQFKRIFDALEKNFRESLDLDDITVSYDALTLYHHVQLAIENYRKRWSEIIGYPVKTYQSEHWSRIKALTRRLGYWNQEEYIELRPLADLLQEIIEQLNIFLNNPMTILPEEAEEDLKSTKINKIKSDITRQMIPFIRTIIWKNTDQLGRWQEAYSFAGKNSTYQRSMKINEIYDWGIPMLDNYSYKMNLMQKQFITTFMEIVEDVLKENNGQINKFKYS